MKKLFCSTLILLSTINVITAQKTIAEGKISAAIQRSYDILVLTEAEFKGINLITFQNPVASVLKLIIDDYKSGNLLYQIYDVNGILLDAEEIEDKETIIHIKEGIHPSFFLKISNGQNVLKIFNIIKN